MLTAVASPDHVHFIESCQWTEQFCFLETEATGGCTEEDYTDDQDDGRFYLRADIYSFSQVVAYALTGKMPWPGRNSVSVQAIRNNSIQRVDQVEIPEQLSGTCTLRDVIYKCRFDPESRPTAEELVMKSFGGKQIVHQRDFMDIIGT